MNGDPMNPAELWTEANQRYLTASLALLRQRLGGAAEDSETPQTTAALHAARDAALADLPAPPALETLAESFGLSPFERDLLLLAAGVELDADFANACAAAQGTSQGDPKHPHATFSLALAALEDPHWSATSPAGPLRRWRLLELGTGAGLVARPLHVDERVLHYLTGVETLDDRLAGWLEPVPPQAELVPSQAEIAERVVALWAEHEVGALPVVALCGEDAAAHRGVAAAAAEALGLRLHTVTALTLPAGVAELEGLRRLWEREAVLSGSALLVEAEALESADAARRDTLERFLESTRGALLVSSPERPRPRTRPVVVLDVPRPNAAEQRALWQDLLGGAPDHPALGNGHLEHHLEQLVGQFDLNAATIRSVATEAAGAADPLTVLWETSKRQARPRLEDLAQRIEPRAGWDDLVLPERQRQTLREISMQVRRRFQVYEEWGFARKSNRGLGISALFAGPSGTGKTMAAEVLAGDLDLDLYRIDLSSIISKYIGETEKNLKKVFDAAEGGGAILLFDEADALFGKRSEVKDSHDRYANIEVSYLLQRMEAYRGLAVLTSNQKDALDSAFLRRLRFVVSFPFPDAASRAEIWRRIFPQETPTNGLDVERLARLAVAGGNIKNIALGGAFLAAEEGTSVAMRHLAHAARGEYAKLEKPLSSTALEGWE